MLNSSGVYKPQNAIKTTALIKSNIQREISKQPLLEVVTQSSIEFPELSYADKKSLEQKILQLYESANTNAYELLRSKQSELSQNRLEKVL